MSRKLFFILVPLLILGTLCYVLYQGFSFEGAILPSRMIDKKISPKARVAKLYEWRTIVSLDKLSPPRSPIGQWYLINFWSSWSEKSQKEQPFLLDLARAGITIYGVDFEDKAVEAKKWLKTNGNPYFETFWDARGVAAYTFGVYHVPETYLVDPNGVIRYRVAGEMTKRIWLNTVIPIIAKGIPEKKKSEKK